ncbi:hypothetical protein EVAR_51064_1 [Eumeta japonica]|uniref:Uncharacterized protein n=1 Tax=Eumeta variegata TaxID=151549 RepID=A0A4C1XW92_EUMVA|nr:hypothetical protein EVAR_51064_1 [Eumeta japonica]
MKNSIKRASAFKRTQRPPPPPPVHVSTALNITDTSRCSSWLDVEWPFCASATCHNNRKAPLIQRHGRVHRDKPTVK